MVSRLHLRIARDGANTPTWHVEDLGAANGTYVNGRTTKRARLEIGDVVCLGNAHGRTRSDACYRLVTAAAQGPSDSMIMAQSSPS